MTTTAGARTPFGTRIVAAPILFYRRWVSPAIPARCRFYPTCSAYALEAVTVHGPVRGVLLAARRLLRCHPFHPGGFDPVPGRRGTANANDADVTGVPKQ